MEIKIAEKEERPGRPVVGSDRKTASDYYHEQFIESSSSASYSKWDDNHAWSSEEWKTDTEMCERSGRPDVISWGTTRESQPGLSQEETQHDGTAQSVVNEVIPRERSGRPDVDPQREARPQQSVIGNDETELELSVESRSFVNRVNDQGRKRQKRISNVTEDGEKHSMIWGMFMTATMESAVFMGKNYLNNCQSIANTTDLTLKQMFDISTRLESEQNEISGLKTIGWENHSWKYLSLIGDERVINLQRTKVYVFSDSVLCPGKILENPQSNDAWEQRLGWLKSSQNYRNFDRIDGEPMEFEWHIFPGFNTLQLCEEVQELLLRLDETPENFTGRIIFMSMFNDILFPVDQKTMKKNGWQMPNSFLCMQKDLEKDNGHSLVLVLKRSGTVSVKTAHKEYGTIWLKGCCWNSQKVIVQFSKLRAHCPEVDSEAKDMENCRYTVQPIWKRFKLFTMQPIWKRFKLFSHSCLCNSAQSLRSNRGDM